jgi:hypothetical protein
VCKKYPELDVLEKGYLEFREFESQMRLSGKEDWDGIKGSWRGDPNVIGKIAVIKQIRMLTGSGLLESKLLTDWWDGSWSSWEVTGSKDSTMDQLVSIFGYEPVVQRKGRMLRPCV